MLVGRGQGLGWGIYKNLRRPKASPFKWEVVFETNPERTEFLMDGTA